MLHNATTTVNTMKNFKRKKSPWNLCWAAGVSVASSDCFFLRLKYTLTVVTRKTRVYRRAELPAMPINSH